MPDTNTYEQETGERVPLYVESPDRRSGYSTVVKTGGTATDVIGRLLWIGVLIGGALGLFNFVTTYLAHSDMSAPQLAALAAECLTIGVLPYVLARAWDEVCRPPRWR